MTFADFLIACGAIAMLLTGVAIGWTLRGKHDDAIISAPTRMLFERPINKPDDSKI